MPQISNHSPSTVALSFLSFVAFSLSSRPERPAVLQTYPGNPEYDAQTEFRNDVPGAEVHVLEAGHFALDTKADEIAALVRSFMDTRK